MALSLDTLSNDASIFLRDVLRNKLTDMQSPARTGDKWIFKGQPEALEFDYPYVILRYDGERTNRLAFDAKQRIVALLRFEIQVWAKKLEHRDKVADQIVKIFNDPSSADAAGTTMSDKNLYFIAAEKSDNDTYITPEELVRIKIIMIELQYIGS